MGQAVQSKNYPSYEEQSFPESPDSDYGNWDEENWGDSPADSFKEPGSQLADVSAKDLLAQLSQQAKSGGLTEAQQKKVLDELRQLEAQLQRIGTVDNAFEESQMESVEDRIGEIQDDLMAGQSNYDKVKTFSEDLQKLQSELKDNKYIPEKERAELQGKVVEIQGRMLEDFSFDPVDAQEEVKQIRDRVDVTKNFEKEAARSVGIGNNLAAAMDSIFLGHGAAGDLSAPDAPWYDIRKQVFLDGGSYLGPLGEFIGGTVGLLSGFSTDRPHSSLNESPKAVQDLDLIMKGQSKLGSTSAPGEIVRIIYNTELAPEQQINEIKKAMADLPRASQTYVLSSLVSTLSKQDPEKMSFLKETAPDLAKFLSQEIRSGMDAINNGSLATSGTGNYDVAFSGTSMTIQNTDTAWYRDDWNDFNVSLSDITNPMTEALSALNVETPLSAPSAAPTSP